MSNRRQRWLARSVPIEQLNPELLLEIGNRIAHRRSRPPELSSCGREASRLNDGQKHLQLVETGDTRALHFRFLER